MSPRLPLKFDDTHEARPTPAGFFLRQWLPAIRGRFLEFASAACETQSQETCPVLFAAFRPHMVKPKRSDDRSIAVKAPPKSKSASSRTAKPAVAIGGGAIYSVHPGVAVTQRWMAELAEKTGRSLDEWVLHVKKFGPKSERECRLWLKEQHHLGANTADWLAGKAFGGRLGLAEDTPEGYLRLAPKYVEQMYAGPREALRPIHNELIRLAQALGDGVRICPCKTIVPFYRRHVFAEIKPATSRRIDLGLALGEEPFTSRLRDTGAAATSNRITHRVALSSLDNVDLQVKRWLKQAYERDA